MKKTLIVVTDLGTCRIYKLGWTRLRRTPRLDLVEQFALVDAHGKLLDKLTDQAGRYRVPTSRMAMSYGERTKIQAERKKRLIKQIAKRLNTALNENDAETLYFAADKEIRRQLLEQLDSGIRAKVEKSISADLTKTPKTELLDHFFPAATARAA